MRAGHVPKGVVRELERTASSLWWKTGNGKPVYKSGQASDGRHRAHRRAERNTNQRVHARYRGSSESEENREGEAVVLADHSTDGRKSKAGKVGNRDPRDPLEGRRSRA
jgi:hypothetical protein